MITAVTLLSAAQCTTVPHCAEWKFVPFRCHSRICPTCGNMYSIHRTTSMSFKLLACTHRHCVFTIPEQLRPFFLHNRSLLNCLFSAVQSVIFRLFSKVNTSKNFTPGFICVLHTFGRDLKWNPHIHCLVTEGGLATNNFGANSLISTSLFCAAPFVPHSSIHFISSLVPLLKK